MMNTWATTFKGKKFHTFTADGHALCRDNIRTTNTRKSEEQVDAMLAGAFADHGYTKCVTCATKEAAHRDRVEASMAPSNGEGDHLPPAAWPRAIPRDIEQRDAAEGVISDEQLDNWAKGASIGHLKAAPILRPLTPAQRVTAVSEANLIMGTQPGWNFSSAVWQAAKDVLAAEAATVPAATPEVAETPAAAAPTATVDATELALLRRIAREARPLMNEWGNGNLVAALVEYDSHMAGRKAENDRSWVLSPSNINRVDDVLDAEGIRAKGYWTFNGTATVCTGLKIGNDPMQVARYGDTVSVRHDGTWSITPAAK